MGTTGIKETVARVRRPATLKDLAGALGIHKSTVSLALSGKGTIAPETRERVLSAARELGYQPNLIAQRLAGANASTTVCLFSGVLDVGLATEKILAVQRVLNSHGLEVPIYTCGDAPTSSKSERGEDDVPDAQAAQVRQLCRQRPRALVCATSHVQESVFRELGEYQESGGWVVAYDTPVPYACDQVVFDREDNAYRAARYLLEQGHRRIGLGISQVSPHVLEDAQTKAGFDDKGVVTDPNVYRIRGFRRALAEFGESLRPQWFFRNPAYEKGGAEMARQFLQMPPGERPTAIAVVNDYVAFAFMTELIRAGVRVPEELSLIGHDDQPIAAYCPVPLTAVSQPVEQIAQSVADLLLDRLTERAGPEVAPRTEIIKGTLSVRGSVAPPRQTGQA